jgi:hypothetical protein
MKNLTLFALLLALAGCSDQSGGIGMSGGRTYASAPVVVNAEVATPQAPAAAATRRYLALKHSVELWVPEDTLPQRFKAMQEQCLKLGCEILSVDQNIKGPGQTGHASLTARVPPAAFPVFFSGIQAQAKLRRHQSDSEDKTTEVIDVDARIKNLEALKVRVLELLASKAGTLKDMLDAEKQLSETQAALDSINGQRRALASLTDMVRIEISLSEETLATQGNWTAPVAQALARTGEVLMESLGMLITVVVALLPWALLLALLSWPLRRAWRRRKVAKALEK